MPAKKAAAKTAKSKAKKTVAKKPVAKAKTPAVKKSTAAVANAFSKTEILTTLAEATELTKKQVGSVLENLNEIVKRHVTKRGCGQFTIPGLLKIYVVKKPATPARKGINPFTGEETMFKAKPARMVVKVKALKKLKEMAA